jgi:hypothetical protein
MKQIRLDFSGGLNIIADKSVLPDKFGTVMDNIDLRSGFPRCFKEPLFNQIVSNADTKKIFNFRGRWLYSENWRDYVADYIDGIERIYWSESINSVDYTGSADLKPQKMVEGTTVPLGTDRPSTSAIVSSGKPIVPIVDKPVLISGGGLSEGTYYYAISAEFSKGVGSPSNIVNIVVGQGNTANIKLTWSSVLDAVAYIIWGRSSTYGEMKRIEKVNSGITSWTDNGAITPKEDSPDDYFDNLPVSYVYTYERDVNGVFDESGLSDISSRITTNLSRNIARDFLNDGYFSQPSTVDISTDDGYTFTIDPRPSTVDTYPYYEPINVTGTEYNRTLNQVTFTTLNPHKLTTDDEIIFSGSAWQNPAYNNKRYKVIVLNSTQFAIKNIPASTDQIYGGLIDNGFSFTPVGAGIQITNLFNVYSETGNGSGAVLNVTFTPNTGAGPAFDVVDTVTVDTAGTGYGVGDVVFIELEPIPYQGQPAPEAIEDGSSSLSITNAGSGYPKPNSIKTLWITNGGSGYTAGTYTNVALTGGTGSGATIDLKVNSDGLIYDVTINDSGLNYSVGDALTATVTGGSGVAFYVFEINSGIYQDVDLTSATGTGGKATVTVDNSGQIAAIEVTDGGVGYTGGGSVGVSSGSGTNLPSGSGSQFGILLTQTSYDRQYFTVTDIDGDGNVSICRTRVTISPVPSEGTINDGDAMYLNMSDSAVGRIYRVTFQGGAGYKDGSYSDVPLTSGSGSGATANITVSNGVVTIVDIEDQGLNYVVNNVLGVAAASLNSNNSIKTKTITNGGSGYAGGFTQMFASVPLTNISGTGTGAIADISVVSGVVSAVTITNAGSGYAVNNTLTASNTNLGGTGSGLVITIDSVYIGSGALITVTSIEDEEIINGLYKVYTTDLDGNPIPEGSFDINEYIGAWESPTELGASAKWVPYNGYYKTWNLYRTGAAGAFQLVEKLDIFTSNHLDKTSTQYLGQTPTSYYSENGLFGSLQIDFMPPPAGLQSLTSHYGMLFGVDGQKVKWTPIGQPDAWPDVYYYDFTYKPLALASFGTALIVLCEDAIYRIDGNQPSSMSLSKTNANEGCIAPYTVQKTNKGLVYLSKRGLMIFDGMNAQCITDNRIPSNMLLGPSKLLYPVNFWWMPTKLGYFYGNFAFNDGVYYPDESANRFYQTNPIPSAIYDIKSFYHNGRYFLVYVKSDYYSAHTTICIDLQVEGFPITTLGMKPIDVIVNELDDAYVLFDNQGNGSLSNLSTFKAQNSEAEPFVASETYTVPTSPYQITVVNSATYVNNVSVYNSTDSISMVEVASSPSANEYTVSDGVYTFGSSSVGKQIIIKYRFGFATNTGLSVWKLFSGKSNMPLVIRSGQKGFGNTTERRKYDHLEFYGNGTLYSRCYIDGSWIADDIVSLTEVPTKARKFNLPKGQRIGYNLDFEAYGDTNRLVVEYGYTDMESPS